LPLNKPLTVTDIPFLSPHVVTALIAHRSVTPSRRTSTFSASNFFPLTNTLPNSVTVPDADADPLPDPLADTEGAPSLPQAVSIPATPITQTKRTTQNEVLM
jgi:hypothetical protein